MNHESVPEPIQTPDQDPNQLLDGVIKAHYAKQGAISPSELAEAELQKWRAETGRNALLTDDENTDKNT